MYKDNMILFYSSPDRKKSYEYLYLLILAKQEISNCKLELMPVTAEVKQR